MALTPDKQRLLVVNTADNALRVFDIGSGRPVLIDTIPIGVEPVSANARTNSGAGVVNYLSDTVSVVDLDRGTVIDTNSLRVTYQTRLMNMVMAIAVNPRTRVVTVVGSDAPLDRNSMLANPHRISCHAGARGRSYTLGENGMHDQQPAIAEPFGGFTTTWGRIQARPTLTRGATQR